VKKSDKDMNDCNSIGAHNNRIRKGLKVYGDATSPWVSTSSPNRSRHLFSEGTFFFGQLFCSFVMLFV
jgi:hypothetical protein